MLHKDNDEMKGRYFRKLEQLEESQCSFHPSNNYEDVFCRASKATKLVDGINTWIDCMSKVISYITYIGSQSNLILKITILLVTSLLAAGSVFVKLPIGIHI